MLTPFQTFEVFPSYSKGFAFHWRLSEHVPNPSTRSFVVEEAGNARGDDIRELSPALLHAAAWAESVPRLLSKEEGPWFRVRIVGTDMASAWILPTNRLSRADFLLLREIMRREMLQLLLQSGVPVRVYEKARFGDPCGECRDLVTGDVRTQNCPQCFGSGFIPPYYAPTDTWAAFSQFNRAPGFKQPELANQQPYTFVARMLPNPLVHKDDIVVDIDQQKCYFVQDTQAIAEVRRHPAVLQVQLNEVPTSHPVYKMIVR